MVPKNGIWGGNYELEPPNLILFAETSELFTLSFPNFPPALPLLEFPRTSFRRKHVSLTAPRPSSVCLCTFHRHRARGLDLCLGRFLGTVFLIAYFFPFLVECVFGHSKLNHIYT